MCVLAGRVVSAKPQVTLFPACFRGGVSGTRSAITDGVFRRREEDGRLPAAMPMRLLGWNCAGRILRGWSRLLRLTRQQPTRPTTTERKGPDQMKTKGLRKPCQTPPLAMVAALKDARRIPPRHGHKTCWDQRRTLRGQSDCATTGRLDIAARTDFYATGVRERRPATAQCIRNASSPRDQ